MYHFSEDKRVRRSAELVANGLLECLKTRKFEEISIMDINRASHVSRATFYRLFDRMEDVLLYCCDRIFDEIKLELEAKEISSLRDVFLLFIKKCTEHLTLIRALTDNNMLHLLSYAHKSHIELVRQAFPTATSMSAEDTDYFVNILTAIIPSVLNAWRMHGEKETPDEIYEIAKKCFSTLSTM